MGNGMAFLQKLLVNATMVSVFAHGGGVGVDATTGTMAIDNNNNDNDDAGFGICSCIRGSVAAGMGAVVIMELCHGIGGMVFGRYDGGFVAFNHGALLNIGCIHWQRL